MEHLRSYSHWDQYVPTLPSRPWLLCTDDCDRWPAVVQLTGRNYIKSLTHVGPEVIPRADDLPRGTPGLTAGARIIPGQGRPHFTVISVHARHLADPDQPILTPRFANREIQLDVTQYAYSESDQRPVIIAGDFNCEILPTNPKPWEIPNLFTIYSQDGSFHYFGPDDITEATNANFEQVSTDQTESIQPVDARRQHGHIFATPHFDGLLSTVVIPDDDLPGNHYPILIEVEV